MEGLDVLLFDRLLWDEWDGPGAPAGASAIRRFFPEFGSFARGEAISKMSEWRKGVRRIDLKIIASDFDPAAITKAVDALNE